MANPWGLIIHNENLKRLYYHKHHSHPFINMHVVCYVKQMFLCLLKKKKQKTIKFRFFNYSYIYLMLYYKVTKTLEKFRFHYKKNYSKTKFVNIFIMNQEKILVGIIYTLLSISFKNFLKINILHSRLTKKIRIVTLD